MVVVSDRRNPLSALRQLHFPCTPRVACPHFCLSQTASPRTWFALPLTFFRFRIFFIFASLCLSLFAFSTHRAAKSPISRAVAHHQAVVAAASGLMPRACGWVLWTACLGFPHRFSLQSSGRLWLPTVRDDTLSAVLTVALALALPQLLLLPLLQLLLILQLDSSSCLFRRGFLEHGSPSPCLPLSLSCPLSLDASLAYLSLTISQFVDSNRRCHSPFLDLLHNP